MDPIYLDGSSTSAPYDRIEIDDDEEDQLASDNDEQPQIVRAPDGEELEPDPDDEEAREGGQTQSSATTNGKRKHQRKSGERVPGHTLLPATRLENILRADGESGPMSKEAQFALSIATEEFIKRFTRAGHQLASADKRSIISYRDMAAVAAHSPPLKFLEDVVPLPMPLSLALETRALKEKERVDEDPALSARPASSTLPKPTGLIPAPSHTVSSATTPTTTTTPTATDSPGPAPPSTTPNRTKGKSSTSNGRASSARSKDKNKELSNGNAHPPASEPEPKARSRRSSRRSEPQGWVEPAPAAPTEQQPAQSHFHSGSAQQPQPQWQDSSLPPPRNAQTNAQPWLAGPASGFIEERVHVSDGPFGATGRTIYSQR